MTISKELWIKKSMFYLIMLAYDRYLKGGKGLVNACLKNDPKHPTRVNVLMEYIRCEVECGDTLIIPMKEGTKVYVRDYDPKHEFVLRAEGDINVYGHSLDVEALHKRQVAMKALKGVISD